MEKIEGLLSTTGDWVVLGEWRVEDADLDAGGWLDDYEQQLGLGPVALPDSTRVDLRQFAALRIA